MVSPVSSSTMGSRKKFTQYTRSSTCLEMSLPNVSLTIFMMSSSVQFLSSYVVSLSTKTRSHSWRHSATRYPSGDLTFPP